MLRGQAARMQIWALIACCFASVSAKKAGGSILLTANSTVFLEKFSFGHNPDRMTHTGHLNVTVWAVGGATGPISAEVLLLDDELHSYTGPSRQWDALTCEEKRKHAKTSDRLDWREVSRPQGKTMKFQIGQRLHARFWYLVLADCSGDDVRLKWQANFSNVDFGFAHEFSAERQYSPFVFLALSVAYGCLVAFQRHVNQSLAKHSRSDSANNKAAHPFARLLLLGLGLALGESLLMTLHYACYMYNGVGAAFADQVAQLLAVSSSFVLVSLLLLVSEGKCVSYVMVASDVHSKMRLLGPFLLSCFMLELWGEYSVSQKATTDYVYTTPCGWALIFVDLLLLGAYLRNLNRTYIAEQDRSEGIFYQTWGIVYSLWFLVLPFTAWLAQAVYQPYSWYMVCTSVKKGTTALVYASLVAGLWPGNVRSYFKLVDLQPDLPALLHRSMEAFTDLSFKKFAQEPLSP